MLIRIYGLLWLLLVAAAGVAFATGGAGEMTLTVLGFLFSTLFFAGLVGVLPWALDKHYSRHMRVVPVKRPVAKRTRHPAGAIVPPRANLRARTA